MDTTQADAVRDLYKRAENAFERFRALCDDINKLRSDAVTALKEKERYASAVGTIKEVGGDASAVEKAAAEHTARKKAEFDATIAKLNTALDNVAVASEGSAASAAAPGMDESTSAGTSTDTHSHSHSCALCSGSCGSGITVLGALLELVSRSSGPANRSQNPKHAADDTVYIVRGTGPAGGEFESRFAKHGSTMCRVNPQGGNCEHGDDCACTHECRTADKVEVSVTGATRYTWTDDAILTIGTRNEFVSLVEMFRGGRTVTVTKCERSTWVLGE